MERRIALIGFGEAAAAFAGGAGWDVGAFDLKTRSPDTRAAKLAEYEAAGVDARDTLADAIGEADFVFSLVTADQAPLAAQDAAPLMKAGALFFDFNSVAPGTKRGAAQAIEGAGGRYVDVAVMSPVDPARRTTPLLLSGPHAEEAAAILRDLGFTKVRVVAGPVGSSSSIKMIRSVMVKGLEALTTEMILAAHAAGVRDEVVASLNASWPGTDWAKHADYNLDRMMVHGIRRAAEMEEVVKTLEGLGTGAQMTRGTVVRQRAIGTLGIDPPRGLDAKLQALNTKREDKAA
jgi:3-hydroxyisobutyrate dehydrogenase-like beta-hydroxyacid dehydrogenase